MKRIDCAIVGAGPAGLACAMQAARQGLAIALFEKARAGGQALAANRIENYPGFAEGITGRDLMERFLAQVRKHGIAIRVEEVLRVEKPDAVFNVKTNLGAFDSKAVVIASGLKPRRLGVPGAKELEGTKLFYYAAAEAVPHEGKEILVIGSGDAAFDQALSFTKRASSVAISMKYARPRCSPLLADSVMKAGIEILPERLARSVAETGERVKVVYDTGDEITADAIVVCIGKERDLAFVDGELLAADTAGLYFAGDCHRDKDRHISIAIGDGVTSAMKAAEFIKWNER